MPKGEDPALRREEVLARLTRQLEAARGHPVILLHENEREIYGDSAARSGDLLAVLGPQGLAGCFDAANFVGAGEADVWRCWLALRERTAYLHVKDQVRATKKMVLPGEGDGEYPRILADAVARGWSGFVSLEPHLLQGGRFGGYTGPELFPRAVAAVQRLIEAAGGEVG
jgi:sugar phosphate isomerase/epimerase